MNYDVKGPHKFVENYTVLTWPFKIAFLFYLSEGLSFNLLLTIRSNELLRIKFWFEISSIKASQLEKNRVKLKQSVFLLQHIKKKKISIVFHVCVIFLHLLRRGIKLWLIYSQQFNCIQFLFPSNHWFLKK